MLPWNSPGKSTGVGGYPFLQGISPLPRDQTQVPVMKADSLPSEPLGKPNYLLSLAQLFATPWAQQARLLCPSLSPRVFSNSCASSQWCYPTIWFFVTPFSSCPQSFPESEYFPMSQLFSSGGQSVGASASASILPMSTEGWFPLGLMCIFNFKWNLISYQGMDHNPLALNIFSW